MKLHAVEPPARRTPASQASALPARRIGSTSPARRSSALGSSPRGEIVVLGEHDPRLLPHRAIDAALTLMRPFGVSGSWVATVDADSERLRRARGFWLAPGEAYEEPGAAERAVHQSLAHRVPLLATCLGFQHALLALFRRAHRWPTVDDPVVAPLVCPLRGTRDLVTARPGTRVAATCGEEPFLATHFCGNGIAARHARRVEQTGAVVSAGGVAGVEAIEIPSHPFFVGTAFQPQIDACRSGRLHPLVAAFALRAAA